MNETLERRRTRRTAWTWTEEMREAYRATGKVPDRRATPPRRWDDPANYGAPKAR